jgi:hypothetical protein
MSSYHIPLLLHILACVCCGAVRLFAQMNIIATDTMRINGQNGNVKLVTGSLDRTLNFPAVSGTLALVSDQQSSSCCNGDTSAIFNYRWNNATGETYTSDPIDLGGLSKELILTLAFVYPATVAGQYGEIILETSPSLNFGLWWPIVRWNHNVVQGFTTRNLTIRPTQGSDLNVFPNDPLNLQVGMDGWMKYVRFVARLGGNMIGREVWLGMTVR